MYTWISNEGDREQWQAFVTAAQMEDPDFTLEMEGPSYPDYWTAVRTRMAASDAPCILTTQAARAQELAEILMPLDDLAEDAGLDVSMYNEAMIEGMTLDGTLRAIPYDAEPVVLYYNKDLLAAAGVAEPTLDYTTDQFLEDLEALTTDGVYGTAVPPAFTGGPGVPIAFANGHTAVQDGELTLTDPEFVEEIQWAFDLVAEHGVAEAPQSGDPVDVHLQEFMAGNAAMLIEGPWFYETLSSGTQAEVGIAVVPSDSGEPRGFIQGSGFGISQSCDDPEAAFATIMKITTPEVVGEVGRNRGTVPSVEASLDAWAEGKPESDVAVVEALLANGAPLETTADWNQVETAFTRYSSDGYRGNRTAEEILTDVQESVR
ncbi:sugar ABC transporter substrate-binding protein [Cellulomonas sp. ATA003]|nr:sugar ABC transporter substrate-binding protein [Cellulomonas sp. ATA003]WNB87419.1 sugar ABC transporter substrate-binding protein [Cellulomonas sp. ATA003]